MTRTLANTHTTKYQATCLAVKTFMRTLMRGERPPVAVFTLAIAHIYDETRSVRSVFQWLFGDCRRGLQWQQDALRWICHARTCDKSFGECSERGANSKVARRYAHALILLLSKLRRVGGGIGIVGPKGFHGKQKRHRTEQERRDLYAERLASLEAIGAPAALASYPKKRVYIPNVPKGNHGGLAAELGVCSQTVGRLAALLRTGRFLCSAQPDRKSPTARMPKRGDYAYANWSIMRALPTHTLRVLRAIWNEVDLTPEPEPVTPPALVEPPAPRLPPATAPPPADDPLPDFDVLLADPRLQRWAPRRG